RASTQSRGERLALQVLHHEIFGGSRSPDVVQHAHVWMRQRGDEARFALEPVAKLRVGAERVGKNLDGDRTIQAGIASFVALAHAAGAKRRLDDVRAELGPWAEGHGKGEIIPSLRSTEWPPAG